jgi:hypothetical protein
MCCHDMYSYTYFVILCQFHSQLMGPLPSSMTYDNFVLYDCSETSNAVKNNLKDTELSRYALLKKRHFSSRITRLCPHVLFFIFCD